MDSFIVIKTIFSKLNIYKLESLDIKLLIILIFYIHDCK